MNIILAITTYQRNQYLEKMLNSFTQTKDNNANWQLIIADDGSSDGTVQYLESLKIQNVKIHLIKNNRKGVHHQFNTIIKHLESIPFDCCFKCDDDIEFIKPGWDQLYINAIQASGYQHLCHFDPYWRPEKNLKKTVKSGSLISYCKPIDVQGAFFTLTPEVLKKVGYMDTTNFGFRGVGHIDYTLRACRAGFNHPEHPFDVINSNAYIKHQTHEYHSALDKHIQGALENDAASERKYELLKDASRLYVPYNEIDSNLDEQEVALLRTQLDNLQNQKIWYETTYGHQPKWFTRLGKLLFRSFK